MTHPLQDCHDKLDRADEHLKAIEGEIERFLKSKPYDVVTDSYPGLADKVHFVTTTKIYRQTPRKLRVLIGEFFYNLRASLDQLAYVLAAPESGDDPPRGTEFPIFKDRALFFVIAKKGARKGKSAVGSGLYKMRGMRSGPQTIVKWLQPYRRINDPKGHSLWIIHDMSSGDRHRKAHITGAIAERQSFVINATNDIDFELDAWGLEVRSGAFEDGTKVGQFTVTFTGPNPVMDMNADLSYDVAFDPKGPARGRPVVATLTELRDFVRNEVFPKLGKFV